MAPPATTEQAGVDGGASAQAPFGVAVRHATRDVPTADPADLVGDVREHMLGRSFACAEDIAVLVDGRLVGVVPIERLIAAEDSRAIHEVMDADPPVASHSAAQELVAAKMIAHGEAAVAVVDDEGRFLGLVPPHRMLAVLLAEHDEDLARIGGYLASTQGARLAAEERISRRLLHRVPWLLLGLLGAMVSAWLVSAFERQLDATVLLAFFIPAVVYIAAAVGTQTQMILVRGLSVGASLRSFARRELITGTVLGVAVGAAFFGFALLFWGDADVALAVAIALVASCSASTGVAMALPWLFQHAGADPAFGSGPLATVVQDLLSIAIYLGVAAVIVT